MTNMFWYVSLSSGLDIVTLRLSGHIEFESKSSSSTRLTIVQNTCEERRASKKSSKAMVLGVKEVSKSISGFLHATSPHQHCPPANTNSRSQEITGSHKNSRHGLGTALVSGWQRSGLPAPTESGADDSVRARAGTLDSPCPHCLRGELRYKDKYN